MRILMLNYEFPPLGGGASPVSYEIAKHLSKNKNFNVDVITMSYKDLPKYEKINNNFQVYRVASWRSKKEMCYPWEQVTYIISGYLKARKLIQSNKYDLCHTHFIIPTGILSFILKKLYGLKYIITAHGSDVPGFNTDRFKIIHKFTGSLLRLIINNSNKIISPSKYLKSLITKNISYKAGDKTVVIPNGINVNIFTSQPKHKIIFSSGRLLKRKGFQYIIEAVSDKDIGYEIHIAGNGPMMLKLKKIAKKSKTKIVFHGWLDNKGREYKNLMEQSAIFILASDSESFGMVLIEAMSAECAIITTNTTACFETIGNAGILFKSKNYLDLKEKIVELISNKKLLKNLQKKSRERVLEKFSWNKISKQYAKNLES